MDQAEKDRLAAQIRPDDANRCGCVDESGSRCVYLRGHTADFHLNESGDRFIAPRDGSGDATDIRGLTFALARLTKERDDARQEVSELRDRLIGTEARYDERVKDLIAEVRSLDQQRNGFFDQSYANLRRAQQAEGERDQARKELDELRGSLAKTMAGKSFGEMADSYRDLEIERNELRAKCKRLESASPLAMGDRVQIVASESSIGWVVRSCTAEGIVELENDRFYRIEQLQRYRP